MTRSRATRLVAAAEIRHVVLEVAVIRPVEVKAEAAAIVGAVPAHEQVAAIVGEQAVHLMLEVVFDHAAVDHVVQENATAVSVVGVQPDVEEDGARRDFRSGRDPASRDGQFATVARCDAVVEFLDAEVFQRDVVVPFDGDAAAGSLVSQEERAVAVHGHAIGGNRDTAR